MSKNKVDPAKVLNNGPGDWRFRHIRHWERQPGMLSVMDAPGELRAPDG